tara:strand:- start:1967 stop:2395 length:429 start_codon:yes stop_codon:yes gene_type:complete
MDLRQATADDVPAMFEIRIAVRESHMTLEALAREGVTPASVTAYLEEQMRGWVVSCDDRIVGFSLADGETRSVWAVFVLPEFEGRGGGRLLLAAATEWLLPSGSGPIRLVTKEGTRAEAFYLKAGWKQEHVNTAGDVVFTYG